MYKLIATIIISSTLCCSRKPFVDQKVTEKKIANDCKDRQSYFRVTSNYRRKQFEFQKCLHPEFNGFNEVISWRKTDTVFVAFKSPHSAPGDNLFQIILDIDSYPNYRYISIDGDIYSISAIEK